MKKLLTSHLHSNINIKELNSNNNSNSENGNYNSNHNNNNSKKISSNESGNNNNNNNNNKKNSSIKNSNKIIKNNYVNKIANINIQTLNLNLLNSHNNNNDIIPSSRNTTRRDIEVPSMRTISSVTNDANYYLQQSEKLSNYIKKYYQKYKTYPPTSLYFYKYGRNIGCGAFGKVNIGLNVLSGRIVAIKSFNKKNMNDNEDNKKKIIYETNLMKRLNHPSIVKILETFESDKYFLIIMEYINGGNLYNFVKKRRKLTEKTAKFLFWQIVEGLKYMHSMNIVHRDIKLENILIDLKNKIKICDFGIGKILQNKNQLLYEQCGTPVYIAPEILLCNKDHGYEAFPVDMWSAGIALYIMLSGTLPFQIDNLDNKNNENLSDNQKKKLYNQELQNAIVNKEIKPIENVSNEAKDLINGLLNKNPKYRYTSSQVLNHSWFKDENFVSNPEKYHLFTKAEMIMLSKTYVDYRYAKSEDLKENFTMSNLNCDELNSSCQKNNVTKSLILAPYNSMLSEESFFDYLNENIEMNNLSIENNLIYFSNKIREFNMNYELNNNGELDNGILINSKFDADNNSVSSTSTERLNDYKNENREHKDNKNNLKSINFNKQNNPMYKKQLRELIFNKINTLGYDKAYLERCLRNNELCHATGIYYLMENYDHID